MRLLALDGNSLINRAYYGIKLLTTKDGHYTNGLYGFLNILQKLRDEVQPDGIAAAFDLHAPTFRHKEYAQYKAGRKGMPDELREQVPVLKELLTLMGCHVLECEGFEADDILGTLAAAAHAQHGECVIATGDRDALQLVDDETAVLLAATRMGRPETTRFDEAAIQEKYGLTPPQLIDLKALMGDASDHIPGVPGVGEKTALDLMHRFGSLDALYASLDAAPGTPEAAAAEELRPALRAKLEAGRESAALSRRLGTICCDVPIGRDLEAYRQAPVQEAALAALLTQLEFFSLIEKWNLSAAGGPPVATEDAPQPPVYCGAEGLDALTDAVARTGRLDVVRDDGWWLFAGGQAVRLTAEEGAVSDWLADPAVAKRTTDSKALHAVMLAQGRRLEGVVLDAALAAYLLNPLASDYTLPRLVQEYAPAALAAAGDTPPLAFPSLADALGAALEEQDQQALLRDVELPLAGVLAAMEREGFEADAAGIAAFGEVLGTRIAACETAIYDAVGYTFNLNSPKQLAKALFEDLGLPARKKTKTGYSTNAEVLESLKQAHPAVAMLLDYRVLSKLKSTYCDGLRKVIGPDGRIHSSFNQTETRTGRISSTEPNLQNIPVRQELGRELRRFFRAREGYVLCDADYSQIELRVLAHMAGDTAMIDAFNSDTDIHRVTASQVFGVPEELVSPLMRSRAKAVNFGIVYGIGPHSLAEDLKVSYAEAKQYIDGYLAHYAGVAAFMDRLIADARDTGYAQTLFGRRRPLPELHASNAATRAFGERVARNMPIQGTAADIIKIAMVRVDRRLRAEGLRTKLILQVHDELIVEAPEDEADQSSALLREEMEAAADLAVRLEVDVHCGKTWYDAKG